MRYAVTGGGSGGHVTPIKYVISSIKELDKDAHIAYVCQNGDRFAGLIDHNEVNEMAFVQAGKYRRYPRPLWQTIIDLPTHLLNTRDFFLVCVGYLQALMFFRKYKADVLFCKGGFVSVPVGLAAATLGVPIVTHDSDMIPGIANKVISKWATFNAVASKEGRYPYSPEKIRVVGVPIAQKFFTEIDDKRKQQAREKIGASEDSSVVLVIGGGLGAKSINDAIVKVADDAAELSIEIYHIAGAVNHKGVKQQVDMLESRETYHLYEFISDQDLLFEHYIASDIIVSRAGATSLAEIAALNKPAVVIPASQLGDQQVNKVELSKAEAALLLTDQELHDNPEHLLEAIDLIIMDEEYRAKLSDNIAPWANKNAAKHVAKLLIEAVNG